VAGVAGSQDEAAAQGVIEASMMETVASLVESSLLHQGEEHGGECRLMMLETIREFGLDELKMMDEEAAARRRHASYFLKLVEHSGAVLLQESAPPGQRADTPTGWPAGRLSTLTLEQENIRAALRWLVECG
jgi:hypothetical protein